MPLLKKPIVQLVPVGQLFNLKWSNYVMSTLLIQSYQSFQGTCHKIQFQRASELRGAFNNMLLHTFWCKFYVLWTESCFPSRPHGSYRAVKRSSECTFWHTGRFWKTTQLLKRQWLLLRKHNNNQRECAYSWAFQALRGLALCVVPQKTEFPKRNTPPQ